MAQFTNRMRSRVRFSSNQRDNWVMDHKQFQKWLSGIDQLSPAQRQEAEAVFSGGSQASASLAAIEASVGGRSPVSALRHTRGNLTGQGPRPAAISVQGVQEDIQCRDRHPFGGSSPQRQVACLWNLPCRWVDGSRIGRTLRVCGHDCIPLATPISHRRKPAAPQAHGHCRGRRNLCPEKP